MYCVYDKQLKIVAIHDEKRVVKEYIDNIYASSHIQLQYKKVKKVISSKIRDFDDLYLVRYGHTYIQSGYIQYLDLASSQLIYDIRYAKDVLYRLLELKGDMSKKQRKKFEKAIVELESILYDEECYTPDLSTLKKMKMDYDPYIYNKYLQL